MSMSHLEVDIHAVTYEILAEGGSPPPDMGQLARNLGSSKPNIDNILHTGVKRPGDELAFGADGMPLFGTFSNSYDRAPEEYARDFEPYPRKDSPSREEASESGAMINTGAARHLSRLYPRSVSLLGALAAQKREELQLPGTDEEKRPLTAREALDVLSGSIHMWSLLAYRKEGRFPKDQLPPETAFLHRTMMGVRMSLLSLFLHDLPHPHRRISGWENDEFTADTWAEAVEENGLLVSQVEENPTQLCPASTGMIRKIISTIVDYSEAGTTGDIDMQAEYGATAEHVLEYGEAAEELDGARISRVVHSFKLTDEIRGQLAANRPLIPNKLEAIKLEFIDRLKADNAKYDYRIERAFSKVLTLLGYNPQKFKAAPATF